MCQADCSGVGYPRARAVININGDFGDLAHYANTVGLAGDVGAVIERLIAAVEPVDRKTWMDACAASKAAWQKFRNERVSAPPLADAAFGRTLLTQPAAICEVSRFAKAVGAVKFFDAGDVQANGFQVVEDDAPGETYTESGASYMGFAVSALLGGIGIQDPGYGIAFTGDGSFMMNPQVLLDAVEHRVRGMIALFDNRRMSAIAGLQQAQYGEEFRTSDGVSVDYVTLASAVSGVKAVHGGHSREELAAALADAYAHDGISLVHVPVYSGREAIAEMGAYGSWNVGNWVDDVQARYLEQAI